MEKKYYHGNEISREGIERGYVDYAAFAKAFNAVLSNNIISSTQNIGYWEQISGFIDYSEEIDELYRQAEELEEQGESEEAELLYKKIEILKDLEESQNGEVFQYYIVDGLGAEIIQRDTNENLFYNDELDMYVWGVTHWGTPWCGVMTNIEITW